MPHSPSLATEEWTRRNKESSSNSYEMWRLYDVDTGLPYSPAVNGNADIIGNMKDSGGKLFYDGGDDYDENISVDTCPNSLSSSEEDVSNEIAAMTKNPLVDEGGSEPDNGDRENNPGVVATANADDITTASNSSMCNENRPAVFTSLSATIGNNGREHCEVDDTFKRRNGALNNQPPRGAHTVSSGCDSEKLNRNHYDDKKQDEEHILPPIPTSSADMSLDDMYNELLLFETKRREAHIRMIDIYIKKIKSQLESTACCIESLKNHPYDYSNKLLCYAKEFQSRVATTDEKVSSVCKKLDKLEEVVINCFDRYSMVAITACSDDKPMIKVKAPTTSKVRNIPSNGRVFFESPEDLWILETRYRIIVAYHQAMWRNHSLQFQRLILQVQSTEVSSCLRIYDDLSKNSSPLDTDFHDLVNRVRKERLDCKIAMKDFEMIKVEINAGCPGSLSNKMISPLSLYSKLVQRQAADEMTWKTCLLVVTKSNLLHIFDFPASNGVDLSLTPDEAFLALAPTFKEFSSGKGGTLAKDFLTIWKFLTPSQTLKLDSCAAVQNDDRREVRVVERKPSESGKPSEPGKRPIWVKKSSFTLRTRSHEESGGLLDIF